MTQQDDWRPEMARLAQRQDQLERQQRDSDQEGGSPSEGRRCLEKGCRPPHGFPAKGNGPAVQGPGPAGEQTGTVPGHLREPAYLVFVSPWSPPSP